MARPAELGYQRKHPGQSNGNCGEDGLPIPDKENVENKHYKEQHADHKTRRHAKGGDILHIKDPNLQIRADKKAVDDVKNRVDE